MTYVSGRVEPIHRAPYTRWAHGAKPVADGDSNLASFLRFILSGQPDFTRPVCQRGLRETESFYRPAESHWYQRLYGMYSGHSAFGDDWLPITEWLEGFLVGLLRWPGCRAPAGFDWIEQGIKEAKIQVCKRDCRSEAGSPVALPAR